MCSERSLAGSPDQVHFRSSRQARSSDTSKWAHGHDFRQGASPTRTARAFTGERTAAWFRTRARRGDPRCRERHHQDLERLLRFPQVRRTDALPVCKGPQGGG